MPLAGLCSCWNRRVLPLLTVYIFYLLLGATIFRLLEKQAEAQSRDEFQLEKLRFLENYTCLDQQALEKFVQVILEAWVKGVNPKGNSTNPSNWDFGSSFFFAGTVVTTIGYGNLAPSTEAGQVFCVFYALIGIPLNVLFLNHLGTGLRAYLTTLDRWEEHSRRSQLLQVLGLALFLTLGTLVILIFPAMLFSHVEGWSFGEGFYFAFITLSTIGFGDYVVGAPGSGCSSEVWTPRMEQPLTLTPDLRRSPSLHDNPNVPITHPSSPIPQTHAIPCPSFPTHTLFGRSSQ
ncbi:potassium channel subfamily K member 16-like isoform X2 [Psammomys obesus]|uniref:potassium channel subfamily K member 16-like isoform X2 n=1 Tax=Psammomys obesus TaxID=48139 RepID=UPI0024531160|nr:potassium channel subfamily K member 16-like isoform X2 [Psammomys obesus]